MGKLLYKKLFIAALISSIAFGGFSALNFYIFKQLSPDQVLRFNRPPSGPAMAPRFSGEPNIPRPRLPNLVEGRLMNGPHPMAKPLDSRTFLLNNILLTVAGVLAAWALNIFILSLIDKYKISGPKRYWIQYGSSFMAAIVIAFTWFYTRNVRMPAPFVGPISAPAGALHLSTSAAKPVFTGRLQNGQLPLLAAMLVNLVVIAFLELIVVQHHKAQIELDNTHLKMKHLLARNQHLVHQLHPHFLFNTLNTLKVLIKNSPVDAEKYLVRLSGFLRSSLAINTTNIISLKDELDLSVNYLDMQKMRFGKAFEYIVNIPDEIIRSSYVPAFSIQLLIENAIKHNAFTDMLPLNIVISYTDGYLEVKNNKAPKILDEPSSSIGLKNLSERYQLANGEDIIINDSTDTFAVKIKALKNESNNH